MCLLYISLNSTANVTSLSIMGFLSRKEKTLFALLFWSAVGTWQYTNSLAIQLPFLVPYLPEGWDLGTFFGLVSGVSAIFLILIALLKVSLRYSLLAIYAVGTLLGYAIILNDHIS